MRGHALDASARVSRASGRLRVRGRRQAATTDVLPDRPAGVSPRRLLICDRRVRSLAAISGRHVPSGSRRGQARLRPDRRWEPRPSAGPNSVLRRGEVAATKPCDYHEFFGQAEAFLSAARAVGATPRPFKVGGSAGPTVAAAPVSRGADEVISIAPPGGGRAVEAAHLRVRRGVPGRVTGAYLLDSWLPRNDGLLLRRRVEARHRVRSPFGQG